MTTLTKKDLAVFQCLSVYASETGQVLRGITIRSYKNDPAKIWGDRATLANINVATKNGKGLRYCKSIIICCKNEYWFPVEMRFSYCDSDDVNVIVAIQKGTNKIVFGGETPTDRELREYAVMLQD